MVYLGLLASKTNATGYAILVQEQGCPAEQIEVSWKIGAAILAAVTHGRQQIRNEIKQALGIHNEPFTHSS